MNNKMAINTQLSQLNLKNKWGKKQNKNRIIDPENNLMTARWDEGLGNRWKADGIKKHKLVVPQ